MSEENTVLAKPESENTENNAAEKNTAENKTENSTTENNPAENNKTENSSGENKTESPPKEEVPAAAEANEAEGLFKKLSEASDSKCLLKKHLTKSALDKLKDKKTERGGTLADCIRSGKSIDFRSSRGRCGVWRLH